jgi:2-methylcitrate dehydratase
VALWRRIRTEEDSTWTRRYHSADPKEQAFGGRVRITLDDGRIIEDEIAVADAHPLGRKPFARKDYIAKFETLAQESARPEEVARFAAVALALPGLPPGRLLDLTVEVPAERRGESGLLPGLF